MSKPIFTAADLLGHFHFWGPQKQANWLNDKVAPLVERIAKLEDELNGPSQTQTQMCNAEGKDCPTCKGTGVLESEKCESCAGTGYKGVKAARIQNKINVQLATRIAEVEKALGGLLDDWNEEALENAREVLKK